MGPGTRVGANRPGEVRRKRRDPARLSTFSARATRIRELMDEVETLRAERVADILEMADMGMSTREIAEVAQVTQQYIPQVLNAANAANAANGTGGKMAKHWSTYVPGVTSKQASALDKMAEAHGLGDGMSLLMKLTGMSRSKVGRQDALTLRPFIDRAFEEYGRKS